MSRVGIVYTVQPQPWVEEDTRWIDAGVLRFGVEWREVDPAGLLATYGEGTADMAEIVERSPDGGFFDRGASIHVVCTDSGHEYLRFDVFEDDPHYHYVDASGSCNRVVPFDAVAGGAMLPWVLQRLRSRLPEMLVAADAAEFAGQVSALPAGRLDAAVDQVEALIGSMTDGSADDATRG